MHFLHNIYMQLLPTKPILHHSSANEEVGKAVFAQNSSKESSLAIL